MMPDVLQSRGFLLILHREGQILKLIKFWLSLLLAERMGNRLVKFDDYCFTSYIPFILNAYVR